MTENLRRSARHLLGATAEVHVGAETIIGVVKDISLHGMGLVLPSTVQTEIGQTIWVLVDNLTSYAITATVRRHGEDGVIGIELDEILEGDALVRVASLPLTDGETTDISA